MSVRIFGRECFVGQVVAITNESIIAYDGHRHTIVDVSHPTQDMVDAPPEVMHRYKRYVHYMKWRLLRERYVKISLLAKLPNYHYIMQLHEIYKNQPEILEKILHLVSLRRFHSDFQKSLAHQIKHWLLDKNPNKYPTPLSLKQIAYLHKVSTKKEIFL